MNLEILSKEEQKKENRRNIFMLLLVTVFAIIYIIVRLFIFPGFHEEKSNEQDLETSTPNNVIVNTLK